MNIKAMMIGIFVILISVLAGYASIVYVALSGGKILLLAALPMALILGMFLLYDKRTLFLLIMIFRAAGDMLFATAKFGGSFGVGALANILIILIAAMYVIEKPDEFPRKSLYIWAPAGVIAFFSIFYSPSITDAVRLLYTLLTYYSIFVISFYLIKSKSDYEYWLNVIIISSILPVLYAFVDIALHTGLGRLQSTFGHPNIFAFYLVLIVSLLFYKIKSPTLNLPQFKKLIYFGYIAVLCVLLILTQTRSAWVAAAIIFAAYGLLIERRYLVYISLAGFFALMIPSVRERVMDLGEGNQYVLYAKLNSYAWRKMLWDSAFQWMQPIRYIYGYGLESFKYYSTTFFPLAGLTNWGAHSVFVEWFFEMGLLGSATLAWAYFKLGSLLKAGIKFDKVGGIITLLVLVGYLIESYSDNMLGYLSFNWYFWFFMGMSCSLILILLNKNIEQSMTELADGNAHD